MLLYLFALKNGGRDRYGRTAPAGVIYFPARNDYVSAESPDDSKALEKREKAKRRSGIVLDDPGVIAAWEKGDEHKYIPAETKKGEFTGKGLLAEENFAHLEKYLENSIKELSGTVRSGSIEAAPLYKSAEMNACTYCDYRGKCGFTDGENGESVRLRRVGDEEALAAIIDSVKEE